VAEDGFRLIAMGASAGGVEALRSVVAGFPPSLPAAVLVVLHLPADAPSALPAILSRAGPLPAERAEDGQRPVPGRIYVAPANRHLLVLDGRLRLSLGPTENGHRPAVDPLFRSAARSWGAGAIGVVLSGARDDGAAGLCAIVRRGGTAVVQDPADALHPSMPLAALEQVETATVAPAAKLGPMLARLVDDPLPFEASEAADLEPGESLPDDLASDRVLDVEVAMTDLKPVTTEELALAPAGYGCPSCGGALFEIHDGPVPRYRCRVGHAWSAESLLAEHGVAMERALWVALRALEEKSALSRRLASAGAARSSARIAERYIQMGREADDAAGMLRRLIVALGDGPGQAE
jgi:two-component system, chemotaxis family, protein-glutamate methylesterase/glutaminase